MWTPTALASSAATLGGLIWRVVEHQYTTATRRIVDSQADHELLEDILEQSKPRYPPGAERLDYLLKTPFRYPPVAQSGSRFRRPDDRHGVFYASEQVRTALAEMAYYRVRFFEASPKTPLPRNEERLTAFSVTYQTLRGIDLTHAPLNRDRAAWTHPSDYAATQALAVTAREAGVTAIRYHSARDPDGMNVALLTPGAFSTDAPLARQTWLLYLAGPRVSCRRAGELGGEFYEFDRAVLKGRG